MDLMYLLHSLIRKKWIIIFCTLLGIMGAFIFTMYQKKTYRSSALYSTGFTMQPKVTINQDQNFNLYEIDLRFNNVKETFESPKVIGMLSYKLLEHDLTSPKPFRVLSEEQRSSEAFKAVNINEAVSVLRQKISQMDLISPFDPEEKKVWDLIEMYGYDQESLEEDLGFSRVPNTDFINITFVSENSELSAYAVNTIGDQFIRFFNSVYGVRSRDATEKLDSLTAAKKIEVDSLTEKLKDFRAAIGTPNIADKATAAMGVVQEQITNLQRERAKLNDLRGELAAVDQQLRNLRNASSTSGTANNNPEILELRKKNNDLESSKAGKSPEEIQRIDEQIDANTRRMVQLSASSSPNRLRQDERNQQKREELLDRQIELKQQIAAAEANVSDINQQKLEYEQVINTGGGEEVILAAKERDLRLANQEYERLKAGLQATADLDVNPENNFRQVQEAKPAYKPEPSKRALIIGLAGVLMLFLSSMIIVLLEFLDTSYKTPSIFQRITKLKLLSSVNRIDLRRKNLEEYFAAGEADRHENGNIFVENLRKLRYELEQSGKKIFLVTSTKPREGKTTIIESLANSLSLSKKKVLIVDANFSNNTLTQKFQAKPSLEHFSLNGQPNGLERFLAVTTDTRIPYTQIIGCNEGNYTPAEILPKNNILENMHKVADRYDFVFVEGAALNDHADSKELAKYVDGIITIFSVENGLRQMDKDSIKFLRGTGDQFIGSVLNKVEEENMDL